MRTSRRITWLVFAVCTLLVIDGFGWVTWQLLSLETRERETRERAETQEAMRLALWRMDGLLNPIIATESARPYFQYRSFYPSERPYARMWEEIGESDPLSVSPLVAGAGEFIRLHFEGAAYGLLTSPQVPDEAFAHRVEDAPVSAASVLQARNDLLELTAILRGAPVVGGAETLSLSDDPRAAKSVPVDELLAQRKDELQTLARAERERGAYLPESAAPQTDAGVPTETRQSGADRSLQEYQARRQANDIARNRGELGEIQRYQAVAEGEPLAAGAMQLQMADGAGEALDVFDPQALTVHTGRLTPTWLDNPRDGSPELIFIRAVRVEDTETLQGFWIDWPALRAALLDSCRDLLPDASLQPVLEAGRARLTPVSDAASDAGRLLAGIPAILSPGEARAAAVSGLSPTRTVLLFAWLAVFAAIVAIAFVLRASLALGERRGRFVSAVTHELRTPLTTFCLYSQMLDEGMVRDEARRAEYTGVLRAESERLAGIVENVLAYARMGSPARSTAHAPVAFSGLLAEIVPSLAPLAERAGMRLEFTDQSGDAQVRADRGSVERVLGNLVDNACKYAADAEDRRIALLARTHAGSVEVAVRDFGAGVPRRERRRIFSPFARARAAEQRAASGLGLGLALSRGVARSLGGDLVLRPTPGPGAEFVLVLPLAGR